MSPGPAMDVTSVLTWKGHKRETPGRHLLLQNTFLGNTRPARWEEKSREPAALPGSQPRSQHWGPDFQRNALFSVS